MIRLALLCLALLCLALSSCGDTYLRVSPTDRTPSISFCTSDAALASHDDQGAIAANYRLGKITGGFYRRSTGCGAIYLRTESADTLTAEEAVALTHELQHAADHLYGGSMWKLLKAMGYNNHPTGAETP